MKRLEIEMKVREYLSKSDKMLYVVVALGVIASGLNFAGVNIPLVQIMAPVVSIVGAYLAFSILLQIHDDMKQDKGFDKLDTNNVLKNLGGHILIAILTLIVPVILMSLVLIIAFTSILQSPNHWASIVFLPVLFLALIISVYLSLAFSFSHLILVDSDGRKSPLQCLSESSKLTKGKKWMLLGNQVKNGFMIVLIASIVTMGFALLGFTDPQYPMTGFMWLTNVTMVVSAFVTAKFTVSVMSFSVATYLDTTGMKEELIDEPEKEEVEEYSTEIVEIA